MPKVPNLNELQIGVKGLPNTQFTAGQARHMEAHQPTDLLSRARMQSMPRDPGINQQPLQRLQLSDAAARQQIAMGQAIGQWADVFREIGIREADEMDRARFNDAKNRYDAAILDAKNNREYGWAGTRGIAALPDTDRKSTLESRVFDRLTPAREKIMESLGNERQRQAFADYATEMDMRQKQAISEHVLRESKTYRQGVYESGIELAGKQIATGDLNDIGEGIARINEQIAGLAQLHGYSPEQIQALTRQYASPYVQAAIGSRLDAGDLAGAQRLMVEFEDYLDARGSVQVMAAYKSAYETQEVIALADADFAGGEVDFTAAQPGDAYAVYNQGFVAETYIAKLVDTESSGNNYARPRDKKGNLLSSAYGRAQFTSGTWRQFGESERGRALRGNMSDAQWLEMRSNAAAAEQATLWYAEENKRVMERHGIPFNNLTAYLFHFGGPEGGRKLYQADPDTPLEKVMTKGEIAANASLMRYKTTGGLIQYFAQKMGVKPDGELPTGRPQAAKRMSTAEAKQRAQQLWPDNPQKQQLYVSRYGTHREVETEQATQAHAAVMSDAVMRIWSGEGVADLPPSLTAQMGGDDIIKLIKMENESKSAKQTRLKRESWGDYMEYSDPQKLQTLSREQVIAMAPIFGTERTQALVTKWESLHKADKGVKPYKMEAGLKKAVIRSAFGDLLDPYNTKKDDREFLENVEYRLQERINAYTPALMAGETTEAELVQILINDLKGEFIKPEEEVDFWSWGGFWRLGIDRDAKLNDLKNISILPQ
ncbi:MAG: hypothetical protein Q4A06_00030 [Cardiobacteriaceae bacterium]|nr:hypothetical protein [Cardiobacteriaceae bacterium]